ncbi:MAG: YcxB family protein [Pseudomonadota bacterium]
MKEANAPIVLRFEWSEEIMTSIAVKIIREQRWRVLRAVLRPTTFLACVPLIILAIALAPSRAETGVFVAGLALGLLAGFVAFFITSNAQSWALREAEAEMRAARGPALVKIDENGASLDQAGEGYRLEWSAVTRIEDFSGGLLIVSTVFRAIPLPDASLPDGMSRADMRAEVERLRAG